MSKLSAESDGLLSHPPSVRGLFSDSCLKHRLRINESMWQYVKRHQARPDLTASEQDYLVGLESSYGKNLLIPPLDALTALQWPIGIISHTLRYSTPHSATNFALLEHYGCHSSRPTGIGKSTIALRLLGVHVPLDAIPRPANRHDPAEARRAISELGDRTVELHSTNKNVRVICSDMPYIGLRDGTLHVASIVGEPILALWDLARSISRRFDAHYRGERGEVVPWLRAYVERLADTYFLSFGDRGMFCDFARTYRLDHVFILKKQRAEPGKSSVTISHFDEETGKQLLVDELNHNPHYQSGTTPFWQINQEGHLHRLRAIMDNIGGLPAVSQIEISTDSPTSYVEVVCRLVAEAIGMTESAADGAPSSEPIVRD